MQHMQNVENRFGQKEEPAPVDRVYKPANTVVFLVGADGFPFLGPCKQLGSAADSCAGGDGHHRLARLGLVNVCAGRVFRDCGKRLALFRDQCCHPIVIGKTNPAVGGGFHHFGLRCFPLHNRQGGNFLVFLFGQLAVCARDGAFVNHIDILQIRRQAVAGDHTVGGKAGFGGTFVFDGFGHREHIFVVNRNIAGENQALAIVPAQFDRLIRGKRAAQCQGPFGFGPRHVFKRQGATGNPAKQGVIGAGFTHRR